MLSYTLLMWREMVLHALTHLVKVGGGRWYSVLSYTLSKWVEGDGTPCSHTPCQSGLKKWYSMLLYTLSRWRKMALHALLHLGGGGGRWYSMPLHTLSRWREMVLHTLIHLVKVGGGRWNSTLLYILSMWREMVLQALTHLVKVGGRRWYSMLLHLVNVEEELNSRFVAYLCLHLCIVVYNVYIYILYRCIQFVFVFVSLLENKRAQSFVLERRLGLVAIHSR